MHVYLLWSTLFEQIISNETVIDTHQKTNVRKMFVQAR